MEPKISLSLFVPGAKILTPEYCEKYPKESFNKEIIKVQWKEGNKMKSDTLFIVTRKNKLITQHININKEAYEYMLESPADNTSPKKWKTVPKKERLKRHFDIIAEQLKAVSYEYEILDD